MVNYWQKVLSQDNRRHWTFSIVEDSEPCLSHEDAGRLKE
jgi:hypothetical protein